MIDQILNNVIALVNDQIGTVAPEVILGNISMIDASSEGGENNINDKVLVSVVNIQQESTFRNHPANRQIYDVSGAPRGVAKHPGLYLNLFVMIGANKNEYSIALQRISQVISFFQQHPLFTTADLPIISSFSLDKITFDLYSTSFEELNQIWGIMGGKYIPSVLYKMRMVFIDSIREDEELPLVKTIEAQFSNKNL